MSNFSFSHNVFYPFGELSAIFIKSEIVIEFENVVSKLFKFGRDLILSFRKGLSDNKILDWSNLKQIAEDILTLSQTTNFTLFQTERVCRPQV